MDRAERIIKYIENELTFAEKNQFEAELKTSSELRTEIEKYLILKNETNKLKNVNLNKFYLDSIILEFREKFQAAKSNRIKNNLGYTFAIIIFFMLSIVISNYFLFNKSESAGLTEFAESLNNNQRLELLENLDDGLIHAELVYESVSSNEFDELLNAELEINNKIIETYNIAYDDLIAGLEQDEVDRIYNEILSANF